MQQAVVTIDGNHLNSEFLKWTGGKYGLPESAQPLHYAMIEPERAPALAREIDFKCGADLNPGHMDLDNVRFIPIPQEVLSAVCNQFTVIEVDAISKGKAALMQQHIADSFH